MTRDQKIFSCDTLVTRPASGALRTVFGKNSDRPVSEAQPLEHVPAMNHPEGSYLRCQYLTIPQARETLAVLGSRPWWLWGYEHGVNEAGVAIGNEAIYTRDEPQDIGLLGMDLVRLGLERGTTAREAADVIVELLETHGQGGNAVYMSGFTATYNNSFIIADARETCVLETSARHWVRRWTTTSTAIANLVTIEDDWDQTSDGIDAYARQQGWWWGPAGRKLNFRLAFEDPEMRTNTQDRYQASCRFVEGGDSSIEGMMRHLRDHFEGGTINILETPGASRPRTVCCHPGRFASATAAGMVVELSPDQGRPIAWCSMATPCTSVFVPIPVGATLPEAVTIGGETEDDRSLWWSMRALAEIVDHDPERLTPTVQAVWSTYEADWIAATVANPESAADALSRRVREITERRAELVDSLADVALAGAAPVS